MSAYTYDEYKVIVLHEEGALLSLVIAAEQKEDIYEVINDLSDGKFEVIDIKKL